MHYVLSQEGSEWMGKEKSKKRQPSKLAGHYHSTYLLLGLFIIFLSVIALFKWGFVGMMLVNGFRLMIGETYPLALFATASMGLVMVVKGQVVDVPPRRLLGGALVLLALTGLLHYQVLHQAYTQQAEGSIFQYTFDLYKNELLTSQTAFSLGGGMTGALIYATIGYLFGQWGTYLFLSLVGLIGLICLINVPFSQAWQAFVRLFGGLGKGLVKIWPDFDEMKQVFKEGAQDPALDDQENPVGEQRPVLQPQSESSSTEDIPPTPSQSKKQGWFDHLRQTFFETNTLRPGEEDLDDFEASSHYMPSMERSEEPVYQPQGDYDFRPYQAGDPKARTAQWQRDRLAHQDRVLDLDFFDQIHGLNPSPSEEAGHQDQPIEGPLLEDHSSKDRSFEEDFGSQPKSADPDQADSMIKQEEPVRESTATASHWHDASDQKQALMDDELESLLTNGGPGQATRAKKRPVKGHYRLPGKDLLKKLPPVDQSQEYQRIEENIVKLEKTFESFGVEAKVVKANLGPSVTKYEIEPAVGVKVSKIVSLSDDIALALAARDIRMEAPIPGKSLIGIEVPNTQVSPVAFSEIIDAGLESANNLEVPLGRDISGSVALADLTKMPHLLVAGATGSGKSVGINVIICSILMKAKPEEVKFLMIDPKKVELTLYNDLPHQLSPVVTNPRKAARALNNVVEEMERRYELFAATGVRNIDGFNDQVDQFHEQGYQKLPKIVVFIDELADLMMVASNDVENAIIRLAQMARAAGIHMIIATQRPSVDVITGIIKANIPSRLAFAVSSGTDSRTILDSVGAEKLLGRGDMLFQPMGKNKPVRVQGAYISDEEVERITDFIKDQAMAQYDETIMVSDEQDLNEHASDDEYYGEAVEMLRDLETISISQLQRKFRIGYNRAARLIDDLEAQGLVSEQDGSKPRQVLIDQADD